MKITIVTISFNQAKYIRQTIDSVLSQDYQDVEYIIVDAGSTDGSREIIQEYKDRLASIIYEPDEGPADGLNKGFAKATGDIFYYLNSDDLVLPGAVKTVADYFSKSPQVDVICGDGLQIDGEGRIIRKIFSSKWSLRSYVFGAASVVQQATFFRKAAFTKTDGFNVANRTCWDGELLVDMAMQGAQFMHVPELLGKFRIYGESISGSGRLNEIYAADSGRIARKILGRSPKRTDSVFRLYYRFLKHIGQPGVFMAKLRERIGYSHA